jgi:hypothetical protein
MAANHEYELGERMMKKAEVKIGGKYYANVSGKSVVVHIDSESPVGGWSATNLTTNKGVRIKSAQRLQGEVGAAKRQAKVTTEGNLTVVENEPATVETIGGESSTAVAVLKKPRKTKAAATETADANDGEKRLSCVAAALKVLSESAEPMNAQELITAMETKGYWTSPGGKTPHATLYSAILRDLAKGDASRFVKSERGRFAARA